MYRHLFLHPDLPSRPIIPAAYVTADSGTGLVHSAPGHGAEDYETFLKAGLLDKEDIISPVDDDGRFTADVRQLGDPAMNLGELLEGQTVLGSGGKAIVRLLWDQGALLSEYPLWHKYPYDWRSKQPVITR